MIIEEKIGGIIFQEQRTYRIFLSEEDRNKDHFNFSTSSEEVFKEEKERHRLKLEEKTNLTHP